MIVRLDREALIQIQKGKDAGETAAGPSKVSEVEKIVMDTKQKIADGTAPAVGVSASNSGRGHDPVAAVEEGDFVPTPLDGPVAEEAQAAQPSSDAPTNTESGTGPTSVAK
jgi:protein phosphatase PTC1